MLLKFDLDSVVVIVLKNDLMQPEISSNKSSASSLSAMIKAGLAG